MSAWITVAITFERMLAVSFPLKVAILSTTCRARLLLAALCVVCSAVTAFPLWTVQSTYPNDNALCKVSDDDSYFFWNTITYLIGSLVVPEVLLIILSLLIFFSLARSRRLHSLVCDPQNISSIKTVPHSLDCACLLNKLIATD